MLICTGIVFHQDPTNYNVKTIPVLDAHVGQDPDQSINAWQHMGRRPISSIVNKWLFILIPDSKIKTCRMLLVTSRNLKSGWSVRHIPSWVRRERITRENLSGILIGYWYTIWLNLAIIKPNNELSVIHSNTYKTLHVEDI